jgi:hypothetical protein
MCFSFAHGWSLLVERVDNNVEVIVRICPVSDGASSSWFVRPDASRTQVVTEAEKKSQSSVFPCDWVADTQVTQVGRGGFVMLYP